jgi:aspartyl-tRNA(Asn)/glutamyl-tRNA(Gln) amidotransferase subunit B
MSALTTTAGVGTDVAPFTVTDAAGDVWELVVGLEVHAELATATKIFCGCANAFGSEPNTNICPVCLGLPGSLPVLNRQVVELAMRIGRALHCTVEPSIFARKNYFYPDMPKDYQVSQYDKPINVDGWLELPDGSVVGVERAHLEEDTGKSTHVGGGGRIHDALHSLVDYNRAGVPLVEIVGRPHIRTPEQARAYVQELRAVLLATGASDAKMEEGSMRVDANVSVRPAGSDLLGTRCEIKNLNSTRSLVRAIEYEARRQVDLLAAGERIVQQTRHWDEADGRTHTLASKEEADDYRYFPEPDLVPLAPDAAWVAAVDAALPVLPAERRRALAERTGADQGAASLVVERDLDGLVLAALDEGGDAGRLVTRAANDLAGDPGG